MLTTGNALNRGTRNDKPEGGHWLRHFAPPWQVLASVFGPREVEARSKMQHDRAIINCECTWAMFSPTQRARRAGVTDKAVELTKTVRNALEQTVMVGNDKKGHFFARFCVG